MPHITANFASDFSEAGPATPACTGSAIPCAVSSRSHATSAAGSKPNWLTMCTRAPERAAYACLRASASQIAACGMFGIALRVARDADRGDSRRGQRAGFQDLERARELARGRRLVAGHEQRARDPARFQPREPRIELGARGDAPGDDVRAGAKSCALGGAGDFGHVRERRVRRVRDIEGGPGRQASHERRRQRAVGCGDLDRGARGKGRDPLLEAHGGHVYFWRRVTTKVSSLNQRPPCFCSTPWVASR